MTGDAADAPPPTPPPRAKKMVSWSDTSSSDNSLPRDYSDVCPDWMYDSDFPGEDEEIRCHHGLRGSRRVATRGEQTGRRYVGCSNIIQDCGFVHWVDPEWPNPMKKRLLHLWSNYELGQNCQREIERAGISDAERRKAMEEKMKAEQLFFKAVEEKKQAEFALMKAEEERKKAEEMKMHLELQLDDIETEAKLKVRRLRQLVLEKEKWLMYVGGVVLLLVGFVLAVVGARFAS